MDHLGPDQLLAGIALGMAICLAVITTGKALVEISESRRRILVARTRGTRVPRWPQGHEQ